MTRRPATILQADIARIIRAAQQCGLQIKEIKPDGTLVVDNGDKAKPIEFNNAPTVAHETIVPL